MRLAKPPLRTRVDIGNAVMSGSASFMASLFASELFAGPEKLSSDSQTGLLYTITHLHPAAYFILFLIAVLSAMNLFLQGRISGGSSVFSSIRLIFGWGQKRDRETFWLKGPVGPKPSAPSRRKTTGTPVPGISRDLLEEGVVSVRRKVKDASSATTSSIPTPLEGMNHPLPDFASKVEDRSGSPRVPEIKLQKEAAPADFKFSSAVDLPSREEMERREKEQLVVSGSVVAPDGKGIPDVLVFLTDEEGNRVGQSCRSMQETGEFKVLANEPGKYVLSGYKRGLLMESSNPLHLPIESGRLEGHGFCMIPEGCVVHGKIAVEAPETVPEGLEVRCVCAEKGSARSTVTDSVAGFRITGAPMNSQCILEVWNKDGYLLASSEAFDTARKREIHLDLTLSSLTLSDKISSENVEASDSPGQNSEESSARSASPLQ